LRSNGVGADSEDARYALFFASGKGNIEVVKLLLEVGVVPNVRLKYGSTPLMFASSYSRVDTIALLLRHNPGVNIQDDHGSSALMEVGDDPTAVELLIENGADIEQTDTDGWTALFCAVHLSELKKMEVLLRKGARTDLRDKSGKSVCDIARKLDDPEKRNATIKTLREFHACTAG
jgi:ankyrin repeat protein